MPRGQRQTRNNNIRFDQKLILFNYFLSVFDVGDFNSLAGLLRETPEGFDEEGRSHFFYNLKTVIDRTHLSNQQLLEYDENIVRHWRQITERRNHAEGKELKIKYFQYLTLLFTEIYLDRYLSNPEGLLIDLNEHLEDFNLTKLDDANRIEPFTLDSLNKIAFWSATGSGKTLLMHINLLQYQHYINKHSISKKLNRIILLTPNEGLSKQHLEEFALSGIGAELFSESTQHAFQYYGNPVEIIDIHKLREEKGNKTFAVEAFEGNNLVFVDEGHRGMSGSEVGQWMQKRDILCEEGFSFEYSATFGQAIKASGSKVFEQLYAKCILFDYSYKWFYNDGYGKQYRIFNLEDDSAEATRKRYLTAGLLSFFQQQKVYQDKRAEFAPFLIEKPLWIFVGGKVTAVRKERGEAVSDVVDILLFLASFISNRAETIKILKAFLSGDSGLTDANDRDIFGRSFPYINSRSYTAETLYADILKTLFNAESPAALHVSDLKNADGELALSLGDNEPFGVINVGDTNALKQLCDDERHREKLIVGDSDFKDSLFQAIKSENSPINILIGSKKFTEGWNSWRVASMGLMNMAKKEGAQVIQLFGRGVRLKGKDYCLKRTKALLRVSAPKFIDQLETLQIFGVRADYMKQFKEYLEDEGLPSTGEQEEVILPVINDLGKKKLKTIKLEDGIDFKKQGPKPSLELPVEDDGRYHISLDWYPKIQALQAKDMRSGDEIEKEMGSLKPEHLAFVNIDEIYFELQRFKNERAWYNLNIDMGAIRKVLETGGWYSLYIPATALSTDGMKYDKTLMWQDLCVALLKKYIDRYYKLKKAEWENDHLEYRELAPDDPNFIEEYNLLIEQSCTDIISKIEQVKDEMAKGIFKPLDFKGLKVIQFENHLYRPLLYVNSEYVDVKPVPLNAGERDFVVDLQNFCETEKAFLKDKEIYLLRNMSKGRGVGFFEAGNFYPDFILWVLASKKQYINFIDPKGLRNLAGKNDPKIQFHTTIKTLQARLADPDVILNSFIVSNTPLSEVSWWSDKMTKKQFEDRHVYFQQEDRSSYVKGIISKALQLQ